MEADQKHTMKTECDICGGQIDNPLDNYGHGGNSGACVVQVHEHNKSDGLNVGVAVRIEALPGNPEIKNVCMSCAFDLVLEWASREEDVHIHTERQP